MIEINQMMSRFQTRQCIKTRIIVNNSNRSVINNEPDEVEFTKILESPIILNPSKRYVAYVKYLIIDNLLISFIHNDCMVFLNDDALMGINISNIETINKIIIKYKYFEQNTFLDFNSRNDIIFDVQIDEIENRRIRNIEDEVPEVDELVIPFSESMINLNEKEETCNVCYKDTFQTTKCKHYLCEECFRKIKIVAGCPCCRQKLFP
jgi:hypothetical protein